MINLETIKKVSTNWFENKPFPHFVVDDFFEIDIAKDLESEFPSFDDKVWHEYGNDLEVKKVCNNWNEFPKKTYEVFSYFNSIQMVDNLSAYAFLGPPGPWLRRPPGPIHVTRSELIYNHFLIRID